MTEEKKVTPQEYFAGFPEAPASDTFKWVDGLGIEHMTTIRAWDGSNLYQQVAKFVAKVTETGGKPVNDKPATQIPATDETGVPIVNTDGKPEMKSLPDGTALFTVIAVAHDKTQSGKDVLKVFVKEKGEGISKKYGVNCFHPPAQYKEFKTWDMHYGETGANRFSPKEGATQVIIRLPSGDRKYPDVIEFR